MKKTKVVSIIVVICLLMGLLTSCGDNSSPSEAASKESAETAASETGSNDEYVIKHRLNLDYTLLEAAESFSDGDGTEENPYLISTREELTLFAQKAGEHKENYNKACYKLTNDIVYNDVDNDEHYLWPYIHDFSGIFDGDGYAICGLNLDTDTESSLLKDDYADTCGYGFVAKLIGGEIRNLTIKDSRISLTGTAGNVAFVAANMWDNGKIINCSVENSVIEANDCQRVGMLCGKIYGRVENCTSSGEIRIENADTIYNVAFGGIAGEIDSYDSDKTISLFPEYATHSYDSMIKSCESSVTFTVANPEVNVGGIIGRVYAAEINDCSFNGAINVSAKYKDGMEDYQGVVGGIAGYISITDTNSKGYVPAVVSCKNNAEIIGANIGGGIAGSMTSGVNTDIMIRDCESNGKITANVSAGGIAGSFWCSSFKNLDIKNCSNSADINAETAGGIMGHAFIMGSKGSTIDFEDLVNSGNIVSTDESAGGILADVDAAGITDSTLKFKNCENRADVTGESRVGGIVGNLGLGISKSDGSVINISGCKNSGSIKATNSLKTGAAVAGGIIGTMDTAGNGRCTVEKCESHGNIVFEKEIPSQEALNDKVDGFSRDDRIAGGIIGQIGNVSIGVLSIQTAKQDTAYINCDDAKTVFTDCIFDGEFDVPSDEEYYNAAGQPIFSNVIGGIIGNCELSENYSFAIQNCTATSERIYGNEWLDDVEST